MRIVRGYCEVEREMEDMKDGYGRCRTCGEESPMTKKHICKGFTFKNNRYYIIDNESQSFMRLFWKPNNRGYTLNLDEAGIYDRDEAYILITKDNLRKQRESRTFQIAVNDLHLLGKKITCIRN